MKKKKKRVKLKIVPFLIALLVIGVLVVSYNLLSSMPITNIYIKGNNYISDQTIIENAKIDNYPSFLKTTTSQIKKNIKKNPYIKSVSVKKKFFGKVYITIEEKNLLYRDNETNEIILEDKSKLNDNNEYELPILLNYIPDTKYDSFIKGMNSVTDNVKVQISEIKYYPNEQDDERFLLYMNDGNSVYLTLTKFKQINYYEDVLEMLEGKKGILYLDSGNHFQIMEK